MASKRKLVSQVTSTSALLAVPAHPSSPGLLELLIRSSPPTQTLSSLKTLFALFTTTTLPLLVLSTPSRSQLSTLHSSLSSLRKGAASWNASYCALPAWATDADDPGAQEARCAWHEGCEEGCEAFLRLRELEGLCCALLAGMEGAASAGKRAKLDSGAAREGLLEEAEAVDADVQLYWEQHPAEDRLQGAQAYLVFWGQMSRLVLDCKKATTALALKLVVHQLREDVLESIGQSLTIRGADNVLLDEERTYGEAGVLILVVVRTCVEMVRKLRGVEERKKGQTTLRMAEYILETKELAPKMGEGVWEYELDRELLKAEISLLRIEMERGSGIGQRAEQSHAAVEERSKALLTLKIAKEAKDGAASEVAELAPESIAAVVEVEGGSKDSPVVSAQT